MIREGLIICGSGLYVTPREPSRHLTQAQASNITLASPKIYARPETPSLRDAPLRQGDEMAKCIRNAKNANRAFWIADN